MKVISLRYFYFFLGIIINSFGIAFITKSNLGTSQISSIPYIFSLEYTDFSFGLTTFIFNIIFILIEIALLRRDFEPIQFLQIVANIIFSFFIDVSMNLLSAFEPETLIVKLISLFIGCFILAIGISIEVAPNVIVVPGEGVVIALKKPQIKFGTVKIYFDITLIVIACILSFIFFGELNGIGIGTIISALFVGKCINIVNKYFKFLTHIRNLQYIKS